MRFLKQNLGAVLLAAFLVFSVAVNALISACGPPLEGEANGSSASVGVRFRDLSVDQRQPDLTIPSNPALVQQSNCGVFNPGTFTRSAALTGVTVGHLLVVVLASPNSSMTPGTPFVTDNSSGGPNTYHADVSRLDQATQLWVYSSVVTHGGNFSFQVNVQGQYDLLTCWVGEYSGIVTTNPLDTTNTSTSGSSSTVFAGSITTSQNDLVVAASSGTTYGTTSTPQSPFVSEFSWYPSAATAFGVIDATLPAGTYNPKWTLSAVADNTFGVVAAYKAINSGSHFDLSVPPDLSHSPDLVGRDLVNTDMAHAVDMTRTGDLAGDMAFPTGCNSPQEPANPPATYTRVKSPYQQMTFTAGLPFHFLADAFDTNAYLCPGGVQPYQCVGSKVDFYIDGVLVGTVPSVGQSEIDMWQIWLNAGLTVGDHTLTTIFTPTNNTGSGPGTPVNSLVPVYIHVTAMPPHPNTITLVSDLSLSGSTALNWDNVIVNGNGHTVTTAIGYSGNMTIKNSFIYGLGSLVTSGINATTTGTLDIESNIFEATGGMVFTLNGSNPVTVTDNEFRANNLLTYVASDPEQPVLLSFSGNTTGVKTFKGNKIGGGNTFFTLMDNWQLGGLNDMEGNIVIGPRGVFTFDGGNLPKVQGNYIHHDYHGGWSQGFALRMGNNHQSTNALAEYNVIRDGSWPVQSFSGEFRYNMVVNSGHDWFRSGGDNSTFHHNLIIHAVGPDSAFNGGFLFYRGEQGIQIYNNTFVADGSVGNFNAPPVAIGVGGLLSKINSNAFVGFIDVRSGFNGAWISTQNGESLPGSPRVTTSNYNGWYNPLASITNRYATGMVASTPGTNDVQANPLFTNSSTVTYTVDEGCVWTRALGASTTLSDFRSQYTLQGGSPFLNAGDPSVGVGNPIGAIGGPAAVDKFGLVTTIGPRVLINNGQLTQISAEVAANTSQWSSFKTRLDNNLLTVFDGGYQGSDLQWISDYALGYHVLKDSDAVTAAKYADKAIGLERSAIQDPQLANGVNSFQFLAIADGVTQNYTLPNSDYQASTVKIFTPPSIVYTVTKGASHGQDSTGVFYNYFVQISNSPTGSPANYVKGTDWTHAGPKGIYANDVVAWDGTGSQPVTGNPYYVLAIDPQATGAGYYNIYPYLRTVITDYTLSGTTLHFVSAPPAGRLIYISYIYGTSSTDGSTLNYQQTSTNEIGGQTSIRVDTTYTARYLGKHTSMGLDWLDGYVGLSSSFQTAVKQILVLWYNYERDSGYFASTANQGISNGSNYGAGGYVSRMLTAIALQYRDLVNGANEITEMVAFRTANTVPLLSGPTPPSLRGGFWDEGWNYGQMASRNLLIAGLAYAWAQLGYDTEEQTWSGEVVNQILTSQPTASSVYNGGDGFGVNGIAPLPQNDLFYYPSQMAPAAVDRGLANYVVQNSGNPQSNDWQDLLYRTPGAATVNPNTLALSYYDIGCGVLINRAAWGYTNQTWTSIQLANLLLSTTGNRVDHQSFTPGQVQIQRGADDLLINAAAWGEVQDNTKPSFGNMVIVDDNGTGCPTGQVYRFQPGFWYGTPGVFPRTVDQQAGFVYASGDWHASYGCNSAPGIGDVAAGTRDYFYKPPDYVVIYDRVTTTVANYPKRLQFYVVNSPTVVGNTFVTTNTSKLFGSVFSNLTVSTASSLQTVGSASLYRILVQPAAFVTTAIRYWSALQSATGATVSADTVTSIVDSNGFMEGVRQGNVVMLFTVSPSTLAGGSTVSYSIGTGTVTHYLTNLQTSHTYTLTGATTGSATTDSYGVLTFTSNAAGTITVL